jgi:hypothetical protein
MSKLETITAIVFAIKTCPFRGCFRLACITVDTAALFSRKLGVFVDIKKSVVPFFGCGKS